MSKGHFYCFIRKDLPLVQQIIQASHACWEMGAQSRLLSSPNMVLFEVEDEASLIEIKEKLEAKEIAYVGFIEPDIGDQLTSICTRVVISNSERKFFKDFTLYGKEK